MQFTNFFIFASLVKKRAITREFPSKQREVKNMSKLGIEYERKRKKDEKIEKACADWLDKFFYSKWPDYKLDRRTDQEMQFAGVDIILHGTKHKSVFIDEKAKVRKRLGQVITHPSFEIIVKNRNGVFFPSWLVSEKSKATAYGFISVVEAKTQNENALTEADIDRVVYGLVDKAKLWDYIRNNLMQSPAMLILSAQQLVMDYECTFDRDKPNDVHILSRDSDGRRKAYLKVRQPKAEEPEMPVNLVIRRDVLRANGLITEYDINRDGFSYYKPERKLEEFFKYYD